MLQVPMSTPPISAVDSSPSSTTVCGRVRRRVRVRGTVQGVGFRPFVHRIATAQSLAGWVYNDDQGVLIEVEGTDSALERFLQSLHAEAPAASTIDEISYVEVACDRSHHFEIRNSPTRAGGTVPISRDLATCDDCWREFNDPYDRRYRYPFLNCTQCGPRFTIVLDVPYDRERTTMRSFRMCPACQREYEDPTGRRFHAEPNACPVCGPSLAWYAPGASVPIATHSGALSLACEVIKSGGLIAVKGIGGYHLVCDATSTAAVALLRARKCRPDKPLAILVDSIDTLRQFAAVSTGATTSLLSPAHPIVLVPHATRTPIASNVAPGVDTIGVMLPALPLHAMLAERGPLVCTSGNLSDEPIAWCDDDARARLAPLVDGVLAHDRPIEVPCDDSVVQIGSDNRERPVRRSRGYAPFPIARPAGVYSSCRVLAVGAELKATIGVLQGERCFLSSHIGDVASPDTLAALSHAVAHMERLHDARAERIACDAHPGYLSAAWAQREAAARSVPLIRVQHHHAHLASLMAEHGMRDSASLLAFTFDGTGYGPDGTIWGGEALVGDYRDYERVASIVPFTLAGGDTAVKQPWRAAVGLLHALALEPVDAPMLVARVEAHALRIVTTLMQRSLGCATTTSMGRLLDACAVLAGGALAVSYEGQGAIEFEALARTAAGAVSPEMLSRYRVAVESSRNRVPHGPSFVMNTRPMVAALLDDSRNLDPADTPARAAIAWAVHAGIVAGMTQVATLVRDRTAAATVGLTGGVFQNRLLADLARTTLTAKGFLVLEHHRVPCNDGGLALGQAMIAACTELS